MTANQGSTTMRNTPGRGPDGGQRLCPGRWSELQCGRHQLCGAVVGGLYGAGQSAGGGHREPAVGFINPAVYAIGSGPNYTTCFHDITTGNNTSSSSPDQILRGDRLRSVHGLGHTQRAEADQRPGQSGGSANHPNHRIYFDGRSRRSVHHDSPRTFR